MTKFKYEHKHVKHLALQGAKDKEPYAVFRNGEFETDNEGVIKRLEGIEGIVRVDEAPATDGAPAGAAE